MTVATVSRLPVVQLELASAMSTTANGLVALALPWLVLEHTGSATDAGIVAAGTALPMLVSALFAGTIVDLVGRRRTAVVSDLLSAVSLAAIPVTVALFGYSVAMLTALAVLGSAFDLAGVTARKAMLPAVAAAARWRLEKATGISESVKGIALMVGPGLGGVLVGFSGAGSALVVASVAALAAALLVGLLRLNIEGQTSDEPVSVRAVFRGAGEGLQIVWNDRLLRVVGLLGSCLFVVYLPIAGVVLPYYFHQEGTPERFGLLNVVITIGGIAGSIVFAAVGHKLAKRPLFTIAIGGAAAGLFAMSWLPAYPLMMTAGVVVGLMYGPIGPLMNYACQERSTERTRGRVLGVMTSAAYVAGPVGYLVGGPLVERLGVQTAFVLLAGTLCVLVAAASFLPGLKEFDTVPASRPDPHQPPVTAETNRGEI